MASETFSMQYPQLQQIAKDAKVRFSEPLKSGFIAFDLEQGDSYTDGVSIRSVERIAPENPFAPYPCSMQHSMVEMNALAQMRSRLRSMINVIDIKMEPVPIPKRKKKSWLRYTSNKKWSCKFAKRFRRVVDPRDVKVLSIPKELMDKINALASSNPMDAAFMKPRPKRRG